jgi:hypothetical protein
MKSLLNEDFNLNIFVRKVKKKRVIFLRTSFENTIANVMNHHCDIQMNHLCDMQIQTYQGIIPKIACIGG